VGSHTRIRVRAKEWGEGGSQRRQTNEKGRPGSAGKKATHYHGGKKFPNLELDRGMLTPMDTGESGRVQRGGEGLRNNSKRGIPAREEDWTVTAECWVPHGC